MNHILGKLKKREKSNKYKKLISGHALYSINTNFNNFIHYTPDHNLDEDSWFGLIEFSSKEFCIDFLKNNFNSTDYLEMDKKETELIDYIITVQNKNEFYFQKISKMQLINKKYLSLGDSFKVIESNKEIIINEIPDAIYLKNKDTLFFRKLSSITNIFKGIDSLYREATNEEVNSFLLQNFIKKSKDFTYEKVSIPNRKRISLAIEQIESFEKEQRIIIFESIKNYCPELVSEENKFKINNEDDLKLLLFGIGQRFYTTPDGKEQRIANSIIKF